MDRKQLDSKLQAFYLACKNKGYPIKDIIFEEAYPGVETTSYIVCFSADGDWFLKSHESRVKLLQRFVETLWETTDQKTRKAIFTLKLSDVRQSEATA